jgi:Carboxypeptidase regulatory-like domain
MMNRMQPVRLALIGLPVLFMASAFGQSVTGKLLGTILDPSGEAVPAAQLTVTSQETGIVTKLQSDNAGNYIAPSLPPGTYTVRVEAQGFRAAVASGNAVNVAQTTRVDVMLQVGQVAESVEVKAVAALVQSTTSDLGETVQQKQVQTLPLNGRIFSQLVQLMPGSLPSGQGGGDPEAGAGAGARTAINASVNGISTAGNRFTVDGVSNSEPMNGWISISPPVEAIEEFKVQTSNPGAEFGVFGGAVVNLTMRSGSNEIHGSLFEYLRNDKLNAKPFFSTVKAPWKTNQFGGTLGGPIVRNKFFIFGDYQGMRLRQGNTYNLSVPTASMQQGILLPQEGFATAYDPDSSSTAGGVTPFPNNTIPSARWDPVTRKVMALWPQPNQAGTRVGPYSNFGTNTSDAQTVNAFDIKGDYQFAKLGRIFLRESYSKRNLDVAAPYSQFMSANPDAINRNHNAVFGYSAPIRPTLLNELRIGFNRFDTFDFGQDYPVLENNILGIKNGNLLSDPQTYGIADFAAALSEFGAPGWTNAIRLADTFELTNGTTWVRGSHTVKFGFDLRRFRLTLTNPENSPRGTFTFGRDMTSLNGTGGAEFAGFLLGYPSSISRSFVNTRPDDRVLQGGPYIQDDWRISRSLTLNFGLRWDLLSNPVENYNRHTNFNLTTGKFDKAVDGNRVPNVNNYLKNFGPRLGLAYSPNNGKTAVRAAAGTSYFSYNGGGVSGYLERNFPLFQTFNVGPSVSYRPFSKVSVDGLPNFSPTPLTDHIDPIAGLAPLSMPDDFRPAMVFSWNVGVQQRIGDNAVGEVAYVATRGTHLYRRRAVNTPLTAAPGSLDPRRPYYSISPLTQSISLADSGVNSSYNSLQLKFSRRFAGGLQTLLNYTYAVSYDDASTLWVWDDRMNWDVSSGSVRHSFLSSWTWDLPIGKGRHFLTNAPTALNVIAGGWSINGIGVLRTGNPLSVGSKNNLLNTGTSNIANKACSSVNYPKTVAQWFDTSCFTDVTTPYVWGNARRGSVWGPGVVNFDLAAFKSFSLAEKRSFELRAEFFNAFNNPHFSNPTTSMSSGSFGQITSTSLPPREIQLGLKFMF